MESASAISVLDTHKGYILSFLIENWDLESSLETFVEHIERNIRSIHPESTVTKAEITKLVLMSTAVFRYPIALDTFLRAHPEATTDECASHAPGANEQWKALIEVWRRCSKYGMVSRGTDQVEFALPALQELWRGVLKAHYKRFPSLMPATDAAPVFEDGPVPSPQWKVLFDHDPHVLRTVLEECYFHQSEFMKKSIDTISAIAHSSVSGTLSLGEVKEFIKHIRSFAIILSRDAKYFSSLQQAPPVWHGYTPATWIELEDVWERFNGNDVVYFDRIRQQLDDIQGYLEFRIAQVDEAIEAELDF